MSLLFFCCLVDLLVVILLVCGLSVCLFVGLSGAILVMAPAGFRPVYVWQLPQAMIFHISKQTTVHAILREEVAKARILPQKSQCFVRYHLVTFGVSVVHQSRSLTVNLLSLCS